VPRTAPRTPQDAPPSRQLAVAPQPGLAQQQRPQQPAGPEDPMMQILQQMLGNTADGNGGAATSDPSLPPGLADLFSAAQSEDATQAPGSRAAALWRVVHAVFALALASYIAATSAFSGARAARDVEVGAAAPASRLFVVFATGELLLQSARFFLEKGQLPPSGVLGVLSRMVPQPWAGYIRVVGRYGVIYTTLVADAMVVIFVLGVVAWWKGEAD